MRNKQEISSYIVHLKKAAKRLKKEHGYKQSHALELVAHSEGFKSWNSLLIAHKKELGIWEK